MKIDLQQVSSMALQYAPRVVLALLTLIIGFWVTGWISGKVTKSLEKRKVDETVRPFLSSLVNVGLKILLLFSVASQFGFETTSFIAVFSALVFAIGLALQGSLGHFASGVLILIFKPYRVGELVDLEGKVGVVEGIQVFNTVLRTVDNKRIIIPNGVVTSGVITNISGQGLIRVDMTFRIGYTSDIDKARMVIHEVAAGCQHVLKDKEVDVFVAELGENSVNFTVRPWAMSEHYWDVYFYMHEQIKKAFDKASIEMPLPRRAVYMEK